MIEAATPTDEPQRLAAVRALGLLDIKPGRALDDITELARRLLDLPIALISLIDAERQWILSGHETGELPRSISFCGHTIMQRDILIVPDAALDPRFHDNPLVVGWPNVRFYAGQPLRLADGMQIGTLCLMSDRPRDEFDERAQDTVRILGRLALDAIAAIEVHAELVRCRRLAARTRILWDRLDAPLATAENDGRIVACNAAFAALCSGGDPVGQPAEAALGLAPGIWSPSAMTQTNMWQSQFVHANTAFKVIRDAEGFALIGEPRVG